jgi:hypothetical protein
LKRQSADIGIVLQNFEFVKNNIKWNESNIVFSVSQKPTFKRYGPWANVGLCVNVARWFFCFCVFFKKKERFFFRMFWFSDSLVISTYLLLHHHRTPFD